MNNKKLGFMVMAILIVFLSSCSANPQPKQTAIVTVLVPQVSADTGAIKVALHSTVTNKALDNSDIYCAEMLPMKGSIQGAYIPSLDTKNNPKGMTDANGVLVISNVKPGKYELVYMFPVGLPELIKTSDSKAEIIFDVESNKVTDLGVLNVDVNPDKINNQ